MTASQETVPGPTVTAEPAPPPKTHAPRQTLARRTRRLLLIGVILVVVALLALPWIRHFLNHVSTDDAYVNGHVTFVAPRVSGQVATVLVDDNDRVRKGDILIRLDPEPYQVQRRIAQAAMEAAQSDLVAANAQVRGLAAQARSARFNLDHAIEDVDNQIALLRSRVAAVASQRATLEKAKTEYDRLLKLGETQSASPKEITDRREDYLVAQARVDEVLQGVYQVRASLGLPAKPETGDDLTQVPPDLDQNFSSVRQAEANLIQAAAQLGITDSYNKTPRQLIADFYKRDPQGDIDKIYAKLLQNAPAIKQAQAKLAQTQRQLDQAELNLRYCNILSEIDGVVTRRNVNPGNNVLAGQGLMAVRSLTEIWVDANFKETQLRDLRIGQPVDLDVDMYGGRHKFRGRISGFTYGTGSTLALLPAENATGNFVKVVQRLPVRVELVDYDPEKLPLFTCLSVTASVRIKEEPTGPNAGQFLQVYAPSAKPPTTAPAVETPQ